jgi:hypothetical protein
MAGLESISKIDVMVFFKATGSPLVMHAGEMRQPRLDWRD